MLANYRRNLEQWQEPYRDCARDELAQALGTVYYHSAIFTVGTYLLNPAALVHCLADTLPANVRIFEQSPVIRCDFSGDEKIVYTPTGSICCGGVTIAVNSFLSTFGLYRWRQVPMVLYATLSEPLSDREMA